MKGMLDGGPPWDKDGKSLLPQDEYVLGFAFGERKGRPAVLLVQKSSPAWQAGKYNGVGGRIEPGETPLTAMVREFGEETGINTNGDEWTERLTIEGSLWKVTIFKMESRYLHLAKQITPKDKPIVCDIEALPTNVIPNLRWIIPFLVDREFIQAHVYYPSLTQGKPSTTTEH
jgi:8-oxo-dGTP diphosphatase